MCIFNFIYFFEKVVVVVVVVVVGGGGGSTHPPLPLRGPWNGLSLKAVLVTVLN